MIPVSVIVVTKDEAGRIGPCLSALQDFAQVVVVDSASRDGTVDSVKQMGVPCINFIWNKMYPKKRGWCLDQLEGLCDWVFFVDADEIVTPELVQEIKDVVRGKCIYAGYFITGRYTYGGELLRHGAANHKIALFNRHVMEFPVVDDLDIPGMGEIEGHYQPVLKAGYNLPIGSLQAHLVHTALEDARAWIFRHQKYARWEAGMNVKNVWPIDPVPWRQRAKVYLRGSNLRPALMFLYSFVYKLGFLDGARGMKFARERFMYCRMIAGETKRLRAASNKETALHLSQTG
ncbi:MAG: glycosyltransferase family 2 protein [Pseudobdellovibrionaceae bacterium]